MNFGDPLRGERFDLAAGAMTGVLRLARGGAGITAIPGAGCTVRVFKSMSTEADIEADLADASLSYANLIAGTQPTRSRWKLWTAGAVTADATEPPANSDGFVAVIATATGGAAVLELTR
jgi:hypothetical protein